MVHRGQRAFHPEHLLHSLVVHERQLPDRAGPARVEVGEARAAAI